MNKKLKIFSISISLAVGACLSACAPVQSPSAKPVADLVLLDGKVYTAEESKPWAQSIAIKDGKLIYIGQTKEAKAFIGEATEVIQLAGRMAMPGLIDGHVHPVLGGMELANQCLFSSDANPEKVRETLKACAEELPEGQWLEGGRWASTFLSEYKIDSPIEWLDQISQKHPISLADDTGHNRWVNSAAMARVGLTAASKIKGGEVVLSEDGSPNGLLLEAAFVPVLSAIVEDTKPSRGQYKRAAEISIATANRFGITAFKEAGDSYHAIEAYADLAEQNNLNAHVAACISVPFNHTGEIDVARLKKIQSENASDKVNTNCVKLFLDGVPSEARTAAVLENYVADSHGKIHNGQLLIPEEDLARYVVQLDSLGFTIKIHAAGDRSVRVSLDAIELARKENPGGRKAHELAHSGFIDSSDIPRFVTLNVVADMSPAIWFPSPITDSIVRAMGDRGEQYWPLKDLIERDVKMLIGTDWPAVVPDMNPWPGIEAMVTRKNPHTQSSETLWPEQKISLEQALALYTRAGSHALELEQEIGSLELGKSADVIVLDRNIFNVPAEQVGETQIELTLFKGQIVYKAKR